MKQPPSPSTIPFFGQAVTLAFGAGEDTYFLALNHTIFTELEEGIRER